MEVHITSSRCIIDMLTRDGATLSIDDTDRIRAHPAAALMGLMDAWGGSELHGIACDEAADLAYLTAYWAASATPRREAA